MTTHAVDDPGAWSGLVFFIADALAKAGLDICPIGELEEVYPAWLKARLLVYGIMRRRGIIRKRLMREREPALLKNYARQVTARLTNAGADVVFSPQSLPLAMLSCHEPKVLWTDATFGGMLGYYAGFSNLSRESERKGHAMERRALAGCRLAAYSSEWASRSAIGQYGVPPERVHVVPFGPNLPESSIPSDVESLIRERGRNPCRLLFNGVDWDRKGGAVAVEVARRLNEEGLPTELSVVGCDPPPGYPSFVRPHGFLSKANREGLRTLVRLMAGAHFMILPSEAECYGVVFAEASAFGVPSLASRTGGIPTAIRNGVNGRTFAVPADAEAYVSFILDVMSDFTAYRDLALSSYGEYRERLNWGVAGRTVARLLREHCT